LLPADGVADGAEDRFNLPNQSWVESLQLKRCEAIDPAGNRTGFDLP